MPTQPTHNHIATIHSNVPNDGVARYRKPSSNKADFMDRLKANQSVIVLCYSESGDPISFKNPAGETNKSNAWDFVVTNDNDPGGFVPDVYVFTGDDIRKQLLPSDGLPGTCHNLAKRLTH